MTTVWTCANCKGKIQPFDGPQAKCPHCGTLINRPVPTATPATPSDQKNLGRLLFGLLIGIAAIIAITAVVKGSGHSTPSAAATTSSGTGPVALLAQDTGESQAAVQAAIDSTDPSCTESRANLAREVKFAVDDLAKHDHPGQSAVGFLKAIRTAARPIAPTHCTQVTAALLVLMEK